MQKLRELLKLLRLYLLAGIEHFGRVEEGATDIPVVPFNLTYRSLPHKEFVSALFYCYTGKLGMTNSFFEGYKPEFTVNTLLNVLGQKYLFTSIEEIRKNSGGLLLLGSQRFTDKSESTIEILGIYLDKSVHPDIIFKTETLKTEKGVEAAVSFSYHPSLDAYFKVNIEGEFTKKVEDNKRKEQTI